jgi:O-antigen/teichoic acid export membrane protein
MASAVILLPFYVQDLSLALFGKLSIYLAFSLLIQIIVTYSFDSSIYIHFHEYKRLPQKLNEFVSSAFLLMILIGIGVGFILAITGELLFEHVIPQSNISFYPYGIASVVTGIFQAIFKVHSSLLQTRERPVLFFWLNLGLFFLIAFLTIL